jgi:hypothetical protein
MMPQSLPSLQCYVVTARTYVSTQAAYACLRTAAEQEELSCTEHGFHLDFCGLCICRRWQSTLSDGFLNKHRRYLHL